MRNTIAMALLGAAALLGQASTANACSPMPQRFVSPFERIDRADHVYVGRVTVTSQDDFAASYDVQVLRSFKGEAGPTLQFKSYTSGAACGFVLKQGYYLFYHAWRLVKAQTPQFLHFPSAYERFDTAEAALAAAERYFAVKKAAETAPSIEIRTETDPNGKTIATLHAPEAARTRIAAALARTNGCTNSFGPMYPGSYLDIKSGLTIEWGDRPNFQSRGAGSCEDPLKHAYDKPGTYTVRVGLFDPPQKYTIAAKDWTGMFTATVSVK